MQVSGGDRVTVPALTLEPGGAAETVNVTSEAPLVQASSGERSFAVSTVQIENLPVNHLGNGFTNFTSFTPGVVSGGASAGGTRLGGVGQNNIMMDGISAMDTGNNGQMLNMNVESIAEVKVLTQGYQAEYGRSSGLQITAVTKSGTNRFRGSAYDIKINSDWNENSWVNEANGDPKPINKRDLYGYSIGGPVGKPGGNNKLFFFYSHEYRADERGDQQRQPDPLPRSDAGRAQRRLLADARQQRRPVPLHPRHQPGHELQRHRPSACFRDGGVLGKIPQNRLNPASLAVLSRYPLPTQAQAAGTGYNYEVLVPPAVEDLEQQPAIRLDYQLSSKLRITGKYSGQRSRVLTRPGLIQGFTDAMTPYPFITNYGITANYAITPTMFLEGTYGYIRNELAGGNENGLLVNDSSNRLNVDAGLPADLSAGRRHPARTSYAYKVLSANDVPFWDGTSINLPPVFNWGGRIANAPPNQRYPGWLNINRTQDVAISLTKVAGRHTFKGGFYNNHSYKAQNTGISFQGTVDFNNDTNNLLDSQFGYANAALGVFSRYHAGRKVHRRQHALQQHRVLHPGQLEGDQPPDPRLRHPLHAPAAAVRPVRPDVELLPGPVVAEQRAGALRRRLQQRRHRVRRATPATRWTRAPARSFPRRPARPTRRSSSARRFPAPATRSRASARRATASPNTATPGRRWSSVRASAPPTTSPAPRASSCAAASACSTIVRTATPSSRRRTTRRSPTPPTCATAQLNNLGGGLAPRPVPGMEIFQYDADVPASWQWQFGAQMALPWASSLDVSYVGNRGVHRLGAFQNGGQSRVNLNAVDIGAAYLPQNQDPTLGAPTVPGGSSQPDNVLRAFRGLGNINQYTTDYWDEWHSIQTSLNRRFQNGFSAGVNYTLALSLTGNTGLQKRLQHAPDGTISLRADQAEYEALNEDLNPQRHVLKANAVWDMPDLDLSGSSTGKKIVGYIVNDWQISGVLTSNSGTKYDLGFSYNTNGSSKNLTGSPDYGGAASSTSATRAAAAPTTSTRSSTSRRWRDRGITAPASNRDATCSRTAPRTSSTCRCRAASASAAAVSCSSGWMRSTRSTRSFTTGA